MYTFVILVCGTLCVFGSVLKGTRWHVSTKRGNPAYLSYAYPILCALTFFNDRCGTAGAKAADDHRGDDVSPASTVPADDEAAIAAARASYQNAKMNTPEEKIRRAPATPMAPLSRDVQSVEILGGEGDKTTERDQKRSSDQKSKVNKKKGPLKARKTMRKHVKKAKKVKPTTKDGAKTTKTKEQTPATTPATRSTTTSPGTDASATPTPSTTGTTTGPGSAPQQPLHRPSVEIGSPDLTEICSPAPGAVAGVLNRAATGDLAQTHAVVKAGAQAALPPVGPHETRVRDGTRVRVRNKDYHNRRMRFYRSLDSFLTQRKNIFNHCILDPHIM